METTIVNDPRIGFTVLLVLSIVDLLFRRKPSWGKGGAISDFISYPRRAFREGGSLIYPAVVLLEISPAFLVSLLWAASQASNSIWIATIYAGALGFSISVYLILNLRHLEAVMLNFLVKRRRWDLSGKLTIKHRFSYGEGAARIFGIFIVLSAMAVVRPSPLVIGFALAPLAMILRNLFLAKL